MALLILASLETALVAQTGGAGEGSKAGAVPQGNPPGNAGQEAKAGSVPQGNPPGNAGQDAKAGSVPQGNPPRNAGQDAKAGSVPQGNPPRNAGQDAKAGAIPQGNPPRNAGQDAKAGSVPQGNPPGNAGQDAKAGAVPPGNPPRNAGQGSAAGALPLGNPAGNFIKLREPVANRVFQRDRNDQAAIPLALESDDKTLTIVSATLIGFNTRGRIDLVKLADGKLTGVPTGGPYQVRCGVKESENGPVRQAMSNSFFVGDLWVLAGQSNMEGVGDLVDVAQPHPNVMALGMDGKWVPAQEPLHWLVDSPDPVHSGDPATRKSRSEQAHKTRTKGAGLGLPFAAAMADRTGVPVGLVICAHGGTSLKQWSPGDKDKGGHSLYGSMLRQVKLAGGKVAGVLWYQGESDALSDAADSYGKNFAEFIKAVRSDLGQPELPFYYVQIGRFVVARDPRPWNKVQEAQRKLPEEVPNTAVISVIDLELDDAIHVGTQGLKRAGQRLAKVALRGRSPQDGATTPTLERVSRGPGHTLVVKFKGVNMGYRMAGAMPMAGAGPPMMMQGPSMAGAAGVGLQPARHITGFSIRGEDGKEIPLIFEAAVGPSRDTVILKLTGDVPPRSNLWYGYGLDPQCNLTDGADMAVPVFGPIALDEIK
jgi:sialate O-acetylesterase